MSSYSQRLSVFQKQSIGQVLSPQMPPSVQQWAAWDQPFEKLESISTRTARGSHPGDAIFLRPWRRAWSSPVSFYCCKRSPRTRQGCVINVDIETGLSVSAGGILRDPDRLQTPGTLVQCKGEAWSERVVSNSIRTWRPTGMDCSRAINARSLIRAKSGTRQPMLFAARTPETRLKSKRGVKMARGALRDAIASNRAPEPAVLPLNPGSQTTCPIRYSPYCGWDGSVIWPVPSANPPQKLTGRASGSQGPAAECPSVCSNRSVRSSSCSFIPISRSDWKLAGAGRLETFFQRSNGN